MKYLNEMLKWNKENDYLINQDIKKQIQKQIRIHKKYIYVYTTEDNIDRFSKWKIKENVFSFVARLTPSDSDVKKYGVRFLDEQANEYTSIQIQTLQERVHHTTTYNLMLLSICSEEQLRKEA